jgi:hypothetical protein
MRETEDHFSKFNNVKRKWIFMSFLCQSSSAGVPDLPTFIGGGNLRFNAKADSGPGGKVDGIAMTGDRQRFLKAGMDRYVSKPIHSPELLEPIESALRRQELSNLS